MAGKRITLRLTLTVSYNPGTTDEAMLRERMREIVNHAADEGLMTGETDATVAKWDAKVTTVRK